jgi:predicted XRE-type DNA-binding protein
MTETMITQAADNIFLDLGFPAQEADNLLIRAKLMLALQTHIRQQSWTIAMLNHEPSLSNHTSCQSRH